MPILLPINSRNIDSFAMNRKSYNRPDTIALLLKTLEYMKRFNLKACNHYGDYISQVVSINMVKHLARQSLNYLLKVSYLDERQEYSPVYELFDDVRSYQYRSRLAANIHHDWWGEFESMSDELDMLHERLKTIRVCGGRLNRPISRKPKAVVVEKYSGRDAGGIQSNSGELSSKEFEEAPKVTDFAYELKEGSGASNENPLVVEEAVVVEHERKVVYHAHLFTGFTDFTEGSKSEIFGRCDAGASNENTTKPDTLKVKFEKYSGRDAGGIQSNSGELSSKEFEYSPTKFPPSVYLEENHPKPVVERPIGIRPDESLEEFEVRKEVTKSIKETLDGFQRSMALCKVEEVPKLIDLLNSIIGIFDNLKQHAEYLATNPSFRCRLKNGTKNSFLQVLISKCAFLSDEIETVYDKVRRKHTRANPMLRSLKHRALTCVEESLSLFSELYIKHPVEPETVDVLIANAE